jgi:sortase A
VLPIWRPFRSYFDPCRGCYINGQTLALSRKLERLLLVVGLLMLAFYAIARIHGEVLSRAEVQRFMALQDRSQDDAPRLGMRTKSPDFSLWSEKRIKQYQESLAAAFSPAVAVLRIPKIQLEVPVLPGTDDLTLNRAVGLIAGTALPGEDGNLGIAGHRDGFFRGLKDLRIGDPIELVTQTKTNTYIIDRIVIVDPSDVSVLARRPRTSVTLVTCYPFYFVGSAPQRYIVQASLVTPSSSNVE